MNHQTIIIINSSKCCICHTYHQAVPTCATYCSHCDSIHKKADLVDGMCPKMTEFGKKIENKPIPCEFCSSEEVLEETEKQIVEQLALLQLSPEVEIVKETGCARCFGQKFLPRIVQCCELGCNKCGYLTVKINPAAKQYHMKPIPAQCQQDCPICHTPITKESTTFRMQCNHQYHFLCLAQWLKFSTSCPVCRQNDMFISLTPEFFQEVRRLRKESGELQPITVNEDGEIVIGTVQEEYDDQEDGIYSEIVNINDQDFLINAYDDQIIQQ